MDHFDVIVAGCGPTGGALANLLAGYGLSVCLIEKYAEVYPQPRAIVLDWEIMRALQFCGVAQALAPATRPHPGTDFLGVDGQLIKLFDPEPPPYALGWPANLTFVQPELERMLRRKLALRANVELRFGHTVAAFQDWGDRVEVAFAPTDRPDALQTVSGKFLVGCDGANSQVRQALGVEFVDLAFEEWWVVVDAWQLCDTELPRKTTQYCWPSRPATYVVGPANLRRWELKLLPHEQIEDFRDLDYLKRVMAPYVDIRCFEVWRHATYKFAARTGAAWRKGRVFLAGDAVHQTPPFLGQGLCAGVRDALNLAWKLRTVVRAGWNEAVLDSYEAERRPHVEKLVQSAKEFGEIIGEMDLDKARARDARLRQALLSGEAVTSRQKFVPDLAGGLVRPRPLAGTLMVQPRVVDGAGAVLMDDVLPPEFLFVSNGVEPQRWMAGLEPIWADLGGVSVAMAAPEASVQGVVCLTPTESSFQKWADEFGVQAVIVRPDRYVHAAVAGPEDLRACLEALHADLSPTGGLGAGAGPWP